MIGHLSPKAIVNAAMLFVAVQFLFGLYVLTPFRVENTRSRMRTRLSAYAKMHSCSAPSSQDDDLLPGDEHAILLGILKKVEGKNAALSTIIVFVLAAFLSVAFQPGNWSAYGAVLLISASLLLAPLAFSIFGMRQLDGANVSSELECSVEHQMQSQLIDDALLKEKLFRFSWHSVLAVVPITIALLLLDGWANICGIPQ